MAPLVSNPAPDSHPRGNSALAAVVLTGGASSRMGRDKASLRWGGKTAVKRLAELAQAAGAGMTITAGPRSFGLPSVSEFPAGGGPVAGICAAAQAARQAGCEWLLVLAVDAPTIQLADLAPLLAQPPPGAAYSGLHLPALVHLDALPPGPCQHWPMAQLIAETNLTLVSACAENRLRLRGANTPEERRELLADLAAKVRTLAARLS